MHLVCCASSFPKVLGQSWKLSVLKTKMNLTSFSKQETPVSATFISPQPTTEAKPETQMFDGIFIRKNEYLKKIAFNDIMWIEASRSYCYIHLTDKTRMIVTYPMAEIKKKLPPEQFIQPHRSYLVNKHLINKFIGNMLYIDEQAFPISRKFKKEVLEQFSFLDNIKDTLGKNILPSGKPNPPLEKKIGSEDENEVISDDEGL